MNLGNSVPSGHHRELRGSAFGSFRDVREFVTHESRVAWLVAAAVALCSGTARADVIDYLGKPVVSVSLATENQPVADPRLLAMVETIVGEPLTMAAVRESVVHLFSLGRYEDVRVRASSGGGGVVLVYELLPLHPVSGITFVGVGDVPGVNEGRLRRIILDRFGQTPRIGRAVDIASLLEDEFRQAGYLRARITPTADVEHTSEQSLLRFAVEPGDRTRVGTLRVEGNSGMTGRELLARLDLSPGAPYEPEKLNTRITQYLENRRSRGFYEARASVSPELTDQDRVANLTLNVSQGPRVRVVFKGDALPSDRRDDLVPVAREGSADEDLLEDSSNRIEDFLRAQGYRDAAAPHSREEVGGELLVTFTVQKGPQYRVGRIEIQGNSSIPASIIEPTLRVHAGQPFARSALSADLATIEDLYRRDGFGAVKAEAAIEAEAAAAGAAEVPVAITIGIVEGVRTVVNSVSVRGNESVPEAALRGALGLQPGRPFFLTQMAIDRDAIQLEYANRGYQAATVATNPGISADGTRADVVFTVREGVRLFVDHVLIAGNERTKRATIERELQFKPGDPLGLAAISESQRRLASLGLFRRARITELGHGNETRRDVLVMLEEAPVTTVGYGGGFEVRRLLFRSAAAPDIATEKLEFAPRASFEVGRRNLFGTARSVNLFASASVHPTDSPVSSDQAAQPADLNGYGFPQYRLLGQFREPRVFGSAADLRVTATFEQQIRSSFNFARRSLTTDLARRLGQHFTVSGAYQLQRTRVFDQNVEDPRLIDRLFPVVRLSSFSTAIIRDTRTDPVDPVAGQYLSASAQVAARAVGSEVGFLKSFFTAQTFHKLPVSRPLVFAGSARLGAARGFTPDVLRDLPASERFYAGGDTTVRGFALDQLGVKHVPPGPDDTLSPDGFPLGGNGLLIFNAELRLGLRGNLGVVGFADTGNVFKRTADLSLGGLRTALGFGVRYKSPVGPIRVDLGFKTPRREDERLAIWFITFGQAF
jgi:outer membrane protein insertion porin family